MVPGSACSDAPVRDVSGQPGWLLDHLGGDFVVMSFGRPAPVRQDLRPLVIASEPVAGVETLCDENGLVAQRYGGRDGAAYLIRPGSARGGAVCRADGGQRLRERAARGHGRRGVMKQLVTDWNLGNAGDDVYAALIEAHADLTEDQSRRLDLRLILLLANHIGDDAVILEALRRAREGLGQATNP